MTETSKKAIKQLATQPAWEYVEDLFREEILEGRKPINFKTEGKTSEMIALEVMARELSAKLVDKVLKKIRIIASQEGFKKESFK